MSTLTISSKGWVVLPAELRHKYQLTPGRQVQIVDYGGVLALIPVLDDSVAQARGILKGGPPLTAAIIEEQRRERERDR